MPANVYTHAKVLLAQDRLRWSVGTEVFRALLVGAGYVYNSAHRYVSDVLGAEVSGGTYARVDVTGRVVNADYLGDRALLDAIVQAANSVTRSKTYANVTTTVNAGVDVGGIGGGANLDAQLPDMSTGAFLTDYDVYLNGQLQRPGANVGANMDYYPGTSLADGQIKFNSPKKLRSGDVLCVITWV